MLLLNKIRLVNWHFFTDVTIDIGQMTLLAGDNGSGKSTIIDAIQYALVANIQKIKFNAAAADKRSQRTLESYCRCKIGPDYYARENTLTHVILQFFNGTESFCAGIMVECRADAGDANETLWIASNAVIKNIEILDPADRRLFTPSQFREKLKGIGGTVCPSKNDYNSKLTHLLNVHRKNSTFNPYLESVVRSVNFVPLASVDRFVCDYILDEREVDISSMRDNLQNYKEAEKEAGLIKIKIEELENIIRVHNEIEKAKQTVIVQVFFKMRLERDLLTHNMGREGRELLERETRASIVREALAGLTEQKSRYDGMLQEAYRALSGNDEYALLASLQRTQGEIERGIESEDERTRRYDLLKSQVEALVERAIDDIPSSEMTRFEDERRNAESEAALTELKQREITAALTDKQNERDELKRGVLRYPESTVSLRSELEAQGIDAPVVADLLEVTDQGWQNAVEGWLNTQRFNILVAEQDFQRAVEIYNAMSVKVHGVGLPNLAKIRGTEIEAGSLAEMVETDSPAARRYVAFLLGDVMMATVSTLKEHKRSITKECMRYSAHTASRIDERVYSRWYLGKMAREQRMRTLGEEIASLEIERDALHSRRQELKQRAETMNRAIHTLHEMGGLYGAREKAASLRRELDDIMKRIAAIDTGSFKTIELQIASFRAALQENDNETRILHEESGTLRSVIAAHKENLARYTEEENRLSGDMKRYRDEHANLHDEFERYYNDRIGDGPVRDILANYENSLKGSLTKRDNLREKIIQLKSEYNRRFNTYMGQGPDDAAEFINLCQKFKNTELPSYLEKIERARLDAERQFRDHFVSKLNEYIIEARESFNEINHTLKLISFGQDQYRFSIEERSDKKDDLDIIRAAAQIAEDTGTLWENIYGTPEKRERVESLFKKILENDLNSADIREICDYRTYFHYDIVIKHTQTIDKKTGKPHESSLSKVLREKSGGETQTPYYVAIAAGFYRFYKDKQDAIRLVLFDEAFNKMDDDRIGMAISFFRKLGMQVVTAVPTEKIEIMTPHMDRTNLVIRHNYTAVVRDYEVIHER